MSMRPTPQTLLLCASSLAVTLVAWSASGAGVLADRARALLAQSEADPVAKDLVEPATSRATAALARAAAEAQPATAELYEAAALQWAEVARDLRRAREAELAADQLERELSAIQTELVRSRAAVEQAVARVGRARQGLAELEAAAAEHPAGKTPSKVAPGPARGGER
jgi:hypothetical protein